MSITIAQALAHLAAQVSYRDDIDAQIEKRAVAKDQDWQNETTVYVFDDNSVLHVSGGSYVAQ